VTKDILSQLHQEQRKYNIYFYIYYIYVYIYIIKFKYLQRDHNYLDLAKRSLYSSGGVTSDKIQSKDRHSDAGPGQTSVAVPGLSVWTPAQRMAEAVPDP